MLLPYGTTSLATYSSYWSYRSSDQYLNGRTKSSSHVGAAVTLSFSGRAVAWVAPKSSSMGSARVYVDGVYKGTITLYASPSRLRQAVFDYAWSSSAHHILKIVLVGPSSRPRVDVDGFIILR